MTIGAVDDVLSGGARRGTSLATARLVGQWVPWPGDAYHLEGRWVHPKYIPLVGRGIGYLDSSGGLGWLVLVGPPAEVG